jgi:hypothetical protein
VSNTKPARNVTALMWFADEPTYRRFREVCVDRENFPPSYDKWRASVTRKLAGLERDGAAVRKIEVDPETFLLWCKTNSRRPDARARATFAAYKAQG